MRRDSIFYALFRQSPSLLFELLENPPELLQQYRFESVAVKEPRFEIDGVFFPQNLNPPEPSSLLRFKCKKMKSFMSGCLGNHCSTSTVIETITQIGKWL